MIRAHFHRIVVATIPVVAILASCGHRIPPPPIARTEYAADTLFGDVLRDDYRWLERRGDPEVTGYLQAENRYAEAALRHTKRLRKRLYSEFLSRLDETDVTVPYRWGPYYYYARTEKGKQYATTCRRAIEPGAAEEIVLDENALAAGHDFHAIGVFEPSPDHRLLAYSEDTTGREQYVLHLKEIASGRVFPEAIPNTDYSAAWSNDGRYMFYTTLDSALRAYRAWRHRLGSDPASDVMIWQENDERFRVGIERTKDGRFILVSLSSIASNEVRYVSADDPTGDLRTIQRRAEGVEYTAEHLGDRFLILTNDGAVNFRLVAAPDSLPRSIDWRDIVPHRDDVLLQEFDVFRDRIVLVERKDGIPRIRVQSPRDTSGYVVAFDEPVHDVWLGENEEFASDSIRLKYMSFVTPLTVYDYAMTTRSLVFRKRREVDGGYDPSRYETRLVMAPAKDGETIPVMLVYRKGIRPDSANPLVLDGYGSYGITSEADFWSPVVSLLDRGVVYAVANPRGSSAKGRRWYLDGKLLHKRNTFDDYASCAEYLVREGWTAPNRLVAWGGSAGGLLMGVEANEHPHLFRAIVANVPFVDIMNTMLDESIPLTVGEYDEWGNPHVERYYRYMRSYSPYDNVHPQAYPRMLITAGLNDPRVQYWEPAKWTARLRATKTDANLLVFRTEMGSGHMGASGRYDMLRRMAWDMAFILDSVGIEK